MLTSQGRTTETDPRIETAKRALAQIADCLDRAILSGSEKIAWEELTAARIIATDAAWAMVPEVSDAA